MPVQESAVTVSIDGSSPEAAAEQTPRSGVLMALSNEMVRLFKEQFGRGPTSARTTWAGDVITVVLENTLTPAERNLVKMGEHERLREMRMFFQYASVREFCEPVERITGRKVRAFMSAIDTHIDGLSVETFILHPIDASNARSRIEFAEPKQD
jgi:uncharacterized protein YbcI